MRAQVSAAVVLFPLLSMLLLRGGNGQEADCRPSSCGSLRNISYPFRLKQDPSQCGDPQYELLCQGNQTVLDLFSHQFYVEDISYANQKIRIKDPSLRTDICSSSPHLSLLDLPFQNSFDFSTKPTDMYMRPTYAQKVQFVSCMDPVRSNSEYKNVSFCSNTTSSSTSFLYMVSDLALKKLPNMCTVVANVPIEGRDYGVRKSMVFAKVEQVLEQGFNLSWKEPFFCRDCISRNGRCSVEYDNMMACYWPSSSRVREKLGDRIVRILKIIVLVPVAIGIILRNYAAGHTPDEGDGWLAERNPVIGFFSLIGFIVAVRALLAFPLVAALLIHKLRTRHIWMDSTVEDFLTNFKHESPTRYSYSKVKKMTNNFKQKLGQGGYGSVYKGKLSSGRLVAVKMLNESKGKGIDFMNEVATIGNVHHVNVVQLVGFCSEGSKQGLIYEYMENGSLDKYIFPGQGDANMLNMDKIHDIALGIAKGIEYLHRGCYVRILHFDIKPHNILLDKNFVPKTSDFGLAKFYQNEESIVSVTAARGALGYMAPEFFYKNIGGVSYKSDVYSFGMLLMEMAGRRKNVNDQAESSNEIYFPVWAYDQMDQGGDMGLQEASDSEKEIVKKLIKVALYCIQMKPSSRPSMNQVVEMLQGNSEALPMPEKPFLSSVQDIFGSNRPGSTTSNLGESSSATSESGSVYTETYPQIKDEST